MTKQPDSSQSEPKQQPAEDASSAPSAVTVSAQEVDLTVELLDNTLIGRHWHPRGLRLPLPAAKAHALETAGKARILGI